MKKIHEEVADGWRIRTWRLWRDSRRMLCLSVGNFTANPGSLSVDLAAADPRDPIDPVDPEDVMGLADSVREERPSALTAPFPPPQYPLRHPALQSARPITAISAGICRPACAREWAGAAECPAHGAKHYCDQTGPHTSHACDCGAEVRVGGVPA